MLHHGHRAISLGLGKTSFRQLVQRPVALRSYGTLSRHQEKTQLILPQHFSQLSLLFRSEFQTSAVNKDSCLPTPLPPKCGPNNCVISKPGIFKVCKEKKRPKWQGCEKICMPCCCPAYSPPDCDEIEIRQNTCKRLEYRIPSFSECRRYPLGTKSRKECCYTEPPCPEAGLDTIIEPLIATKVRQETILGRRSGGRSSQARSFSTSAIDFKKDDTCKKIANMPCLKPSGVTATNPRASKKTCKKQCMPCCSPARDPPECYYPDEKVKCERKKPPRPSFSECEKDLRKISECECKDTRVPCSQSKRSSVGSC